MIELSPRTVKMMKSTVSETFMVPTNEIPRVIFHGIVLSAIIAGFWLLDSMKDPILANTTGIEYQPIAKFVSVIATLFVVCIYDFLTSIVSKLTLFHLVSWIYGVTFMILSALLSDPEKGLTSHTPRGPRRLIGWVSYFIIESYGSLMVALFWSFTNSVMDLEQAKGAYGLIIAIAQIGAILGSTLATNAGEVGVSQLFLAGSMTVLSVSLMMKMYCILYKDKATTDVMLTISEHIITVENGNKNAFLAAIQRFFSGFTDGFLLIIKHPYTMKIFAVSCLYEIVVTIIDYQFKIMGASSSSTLETFGDEARFANLLGKFGQLTNVLSLLVSTFGFSLIVHRIGVKYSLLIFPIFLFCAVILVNLAGTLSVLFVSVSLVKALIFSFHDPVKELLYNPTSDAIKFKAKAWIDVFGSRLAKAAGSFVTNMGRGDMAKLRHISEIPSLVLAMIILGVAWSVGEEFQFLVDNHQIVGEDKPHYYGEVHYLNLPERNGLKPGEVGYDGYDSHLFTGVFDDHPDQHK